MKIVYISTSQGSLGGGEYYLTILAKAIRRNYGIIPQVVMSYERCMDKWQDRLELTGITVHRIRLRNLYSYKTRSIGCSLDPRNKWIVRKLIDRIKPDIVHVNQQNVEDGLDVVSAAVSKMPQRVVGSIHNAQLLRSIVTHGRAMREWWSYRFYSKVPYHRIFVSHASRRSFERAVPSFVGFNHVVWNGLDKMDNVVLTRESRNKAKAQFGIASNAFVFGFAGRHTYQKNIKLAIQAFANLSNAKAIFLVAGSGDETNELLKYASDLGISNQLKWPGYLDDKEMNSFYQAIDVFVLPSSFEGFPLVLIEAMIRGVPCISTAVDGSVEALNYGKVGFLVPLNDAQAMSKAMQTLLCDESLRMKCSIEGKAFAYENLTSDTMAQNTFLVYDEMISGANTVSS